MAIASGSFAELLWPGIHGLWGADYNDWPVLWSQIFNKEKTKLAFDKDQGVTGLGLAGIKEQGRGVAYSDPFQGYQKEYVQVTYAIGTSVTKEMVFHEQYNYINKLPKMIARSMRETEETIHFNQLNNGFSSSFTGADGLSLFNAAHLLVNNSTYRNQPSTASDLTQASVEQAFIDIMDWTDDQGLRKMFKPLILVAPTAERFNAERILETKYAVWSADNDINPIQGKLKLVVSPYLTDTDAWFITTDCPDGLKALYAWEGDLERDNDFNSKNLLMTGSIRFASGWTDPHGAYGSAGA